MSRVLSMSDDLGKSLESYMPAEVMVATENQALVLAIQALHDRKSVLLESKPMGQWRIRCRDEAWLQRVVETI